ncbi:MAG: C_GCAxxG_C_C family protein [Bacteroides sp.]|nr:C_GCAxxG_C_C family protein [Bacteroides sp.]MBD5358732.1 C_GCAxxG_C_C family protein [Bacteroides sp.]
MTTEQRIEKGLTLRKQGYNCAQSVVMAFTDVTGLDDDTSAKISASLGGGVTLGEICGVANGIAIVEGLITNDPSGDGKKKAMPATKRLLTEFSSPFGGCITCRDLKEKCGKSCEELIAQGIKILADSLS